MPVKAGKDKKGSFYRYGSQKKYYFNPGSASSRAAARNKAAKQGRAIKHKQEER